MDGDGVRIREEVGARWLVRLLGAAAAVVTAATLLAVAVIRLAPGNEAAVPATTPAPPGAPTTAGARPPDGTVERSSSGAAAERRRPLRATRRKPAPAAADAPSPEVSAKEVISGLVASGERGGIAAFPPPGTKPVRSGIVVPDEFALPEGYVRHFQTTDDGERLPAILMFHPDYEFVDENGAPVSLPEDRVVPPDMAPPGLPIRMLEIPGAERAPAPTP